MDVVVGQERAIRAVVIGRSVWSAFIGRRSFSNGPIHQEICWQTALPNKAPSFLHDTTRLRAHSAHYRGTGGTRRLRKTRLAAASIMYESASPKHARSVLAAKTRCVFEAVRSYRFDLAPAIVPFAPSSSSSLSLLLSLSFASCTSSWNKEHEQGRGRRYAAV